MKKQKKLLMGSRTILALGFCLIFYTSPAFCSGVSITNVRRGAYDSNGNVEVIFDVSWNKSWYLSSGPGNWDAVWVFLKFRKNGGPWEHARLNDSSFHTVPAGASLSVGLVDTSSAFDINSNPGVGVFLYRNSVGTGSTLISGVTLSWNFSANGVLQGEIVDLTVLGIEMAYVPQSAFYAGDNAASQASFKQGSSDNDPWYIGGESAITVTNSPGSGTSVNSMAAEYYYSTDINADDDSTSANFVIPVAFPKGFSGFYIMKGEISQDQWLTFFNMLTSAVQQTNRDITSATGKNSDSLSVGNNLSWTGTGLAVLPDLGGGADRRANPINYLSWSDFTAYLDWAGLRPLSELEFEKAARRPLTPVNGEYAWGTTTATSVTSITNSGLPDERGNAGSNSNFTNAGIFNAPFRVGSFGYNTGTNTRQASGAGYYGAMELSGNLQERVVTVGNASGRLFERNRHGDGNLDNNGNADVPTWPSNTTAIGSGVRGGAWDVNSTVMPISNRRRAGSASPGRSLSYAGRGCRSALP